MSKKQLLTWKYISTLRDFHSREKPSHFICPCYTNIKGNLIISYETSLWVMTAHNVRPVHVFTMQYIINL